MAWGAQAAQMGTMIVGGSEGDIGSDSYVVSLQSSSGHYCGGSLISPNYVLTAGHCVDFIRPGAMKVVIGSQSTAGTEIGAEQHRVKRVVTHPKFQNTWFDITYDYALVELETASAHAPVELTPAGALPAEISKDGFSTVLGWGVLEENSPAVAETLMQVDLPLVNFDECQAAYDGKLNESMICAGYKIGGKDSCQGDSGGPLVVRDVQNHKVLVGVVSWGEGCARPDKYGVYSNIALVREWIDTTIAAQTR
ncbi:MAG TPA: serine protease [Bdellovibrionota bacterium]|nr:serine protease [Bdellovibrionota bacterium]